MPSKKLTVEQQELFGVLTQLQKKFVTHLLTGCNQSDAYRKAGGKAKTPEAVRATASEILANPNVKAFMQSVQQASVNEAIMTREEALQRLTMIARTSLADLATFGTHMVGEDEDGEPVWQTTWSFKNSTDLNPSQMGAISELTAGKDGLKIKLHDPKAAIKQLAEMQGWEAPAKHDLTSSDGSMTPVSYDLSHLTFEQLLALRGRPKN